MSNLLSSGSSPDHIKNFQTITCIEPNVITNFGLQIKPESQIWFNGELYVKFQPEWRNRQTQET